MLKLRRVGMLLLSFFMAVAMTGCGGDSDIASDKKNNKPDYKTETIETKENMRVYKIIAESSMSDEDYKQLERVLYDRAIMYSELADIKINRDDSTVSICIPNPDGAEDADIYEIISSRGRLEFIENYGEESERVILNNNDIKAAQMVINEDNYFPDYVVNIKLTEEGKDKFARATAANIGKEIAILYDDILICSPKVLTEITDGICQINGLKDGKKQAQKIATAVQGGLLPCELELIIQE